jgi:hypothetical protein
MFSGNFWDGALGGAIGGSAGYVIGGTIAAHMETIAKTAIAALNLTVETIGFIVDVAGAMISSPLEVTGAIIGDIIYGPLDQMMIIGEDRITGQTKEITLRSFRFNEKIGYSYAVSKNEIHVGHTTFRSLRGDYGSLKKWSAEVHIAHEIGHTFQASEMGIFYGTSVVPLTFPANILTRFGISNTPLHVFENDATYRGIYKGIKQ